MAKVRKNLKTDICEMERRMMLVYVTRRTMSSLAAKLTLRAILITSVLLFTEFASDESTFEHP